MDNNTADKSSVLFVTTLSSFLVPFMGSSFNIALRSIETEFAIDAVMLSWLATSFILAAAIFLVPFGRIADIYGRKKVFTYGILIYTIASLLAAVSASVVLFIAARILQGMGGAMMFGTAVAILSSVFPQAERGKALGINVAAVYLGLSLGPFLGGLLTHHLGWRSIFVVNIPLGLLLLVFIFWKLPGEWAEAKGERFDFIGALMYGLMLSAIMFGFCLLPARNGLLLIIIGCLGAVAFVLREIKVPGPVLNINLFRNNPVFAFSNLAALINYSATFAVGFLLSLYLQYIKGFNPQETGLILVSQPVIMTVFSPLAGRFSDRVEPRILASIGMGLSVIGLFLLSFLTAQATLGFIVGSLIILGFGCAFFSSPNTNAVMSSVEKRFYGIASGTLGTMRLVGQLFSMGIASMIFATQIGRVRLTPEHYAAFMESLKSAFLIFAVLCFVGIFASLIRGKVR